MSKHLSMRSGNPALSKDTFLISNHSENEAMTLNGTVNKTFISIACVLATASFTWNNPNPGLMMFGGIGGFIVALITIFKKELSPYTTIIYSLLKGLMLGGVSRMFEFNYPGIVGQAVFLTVGILLALLFAYKSEIIKVTENFKLGVFAATGGIFLVYIINFVMSFFGPGIPIMDPSNGSMFSIGFSLFVVAIASFNLVLDFDFIEEGAERGAPKYMEWYGAFGLLVTLIWLYLEILRLLAKLQSRR